MGLNDHAFKVFSGSANPGLAQRVCDRLGVALGDAHCGRFSDGECRVFLNESLRGEAVYIIQPTCSPTNDNFMELLLLIDAARRASAKEINVVTPYFGYARQDKKIKPREPVTARLVASLLETAGAGKVFSIDLHAEQIQGFFTIPVDHLYSGPILADFAKNRGYGGNETAVVSPDVSGVARAKNLSEWLDASLVIIAKRRPEPNCVDVIEVIGSVDGKKCLIIDDMIDTGGSVIAGANMLMSKGAKSVSVIASHGVFSGNATERLQDSIINEVTVLDTIVTPVEKMFAKLNILPCDGLIASAIQRDIEHGSVSELFQGWR